MSFELPKGTGGAFAFGLPQQAADHMAALIARNGKMAADAMAAWQNELRAFATQRMQANVDLQNAIASSQNLAEVVALQREWALATAQACMEEGRKLTELGASLAREGMAAWTEQVAPRSDPESTPPGKSVQ